MICLECNALKINSAQIASGKNLRIELQLTLMASSLFRILGVQIGRGYEEASGRHIFRDFINAVGLITLTEDEVIVR